MQNINVLPISTSVIEKAATDLARYFKIKDKISYVNTRLVSKLSLTSSSHETTQVLALRQEGTLVFILPYNYQRYLVYLGSALGHNYMTIDTVPVLSWITDTDEEFLNRRGFKKRITTAQEIFNDAARLDLVDNEVYLRTTSVKHNRNIIEFPRELEMINTINMSAPPTSEKALLELAETLAKLKTDTKKTVAKLKEEITNASAWYHQALVQYGEEIRHLHNENRELSETIKRMEERLTSLEQKKAPVFVVQQLAE